MNHPNNNLVREKGPVRVALVCLGEGYNGEYDPTNPEDELLLRFDLFLKDETNGEWMPAESRCTCLANEAPLQDKEAALDILLNRFYEAFTNHIEQDLGALADELSYISADTVLQYAGIGEAEIATGLTM